MCPEFPPPLNKEELKQLLLELLQKDEDVRKTIREIFKPLVGKMTEVEFRPIKKIIILEDIKYESLDDFFAVMVAGIPPGTPINVLWAEGVVFRHSAMPPLEAIVKDRIEGIVYWDHVSYAKMDQYQREYKIGLHTVGIIKATAPALINAARVLKAKLKP